MSRTITVAMDLPSDRSYHRATIEAIGLAVDPFGPTRRGSGRDNGSHHGRGDGVVVGPGSPYRGPDAVDDLIRRARERGIPLVAREAAANTCGSCTHETCVASPTPRMPSTTRGERTSSRCCRARCGTTRSRLNSGRVRRFNGSMELLWPTNAPRATTGSNQHSRTLPRSRDASRS